MPDLCRCERESQAENTLRNKRNTLTQFQEYLGAPRPIAALTASDVEDFLDSRSGLPRVEKYVPASPCFSRPEATAATSHASTSSLQYMQNKRYPA